MKNLIRQKRFWLITAAGLFILAIVARQALFKLVITYHADQTIAVKPSPDLELPSLPTNPTIEEIIEAGLSQTADRLSYRLSSRENLNPAALNKSGEAHCVGYASYCAAQISGMLKANGMRGRYRIQHLRGTQRLFGWEWQSNSNIPAWLRDHDYLIVMDLQTKETWTIDPTLYDYVRISAVKADFEY